MEKSREENRQERPAHMMAIQRREEQAMELNMQRAVEVILLAEQRHNLDVEKKEWQLHKGQELSESNRKIS